MAQIFRAGANTIARVVLVALVAVPAAALFFAGWLLRSSYGTGVDRIVEQPVPFSHEHHVSGLGIDCRYCHTTVETAAFAGLPSTKTCMTCHSQLWTNAAMLAPVRESMANGVPLRWRRVHDLPDFVYFDHSIHVAKGIGCSTCHGQVDDMPLMRKTETLHMQWCLDCHRAPEAYLRPRDEVFSMDRRPPERQRATGAELARRYHVETSKLSDCSICHR